MKETGRSEGRSSVVFDALTSFFPFFSSWSPSAFFRIPPKNDCLFLDFGVGESGASRSSTSFSFRLVGAEAESIKTHPRRRSEYSHESMPEIQYFDLNRERRPLTRKISHSACLFLHINLFRLLGGGEIGQKIHEVLLETEIFICFPGKFLTLHNRAHRLDGVGGERQKDIAI